MAHGRSPRSTRRDEQGLSLVETIVATLIVVILAASVVGAGLTNRRETNYAEVRRQAIALCQERFETVRAQFRYDDIVKTRIDTLITLDGTTFTHRSRVTNVYNPIVADSLELMKFVTDTVSWTIAAPSGIPVKRKAMMSTYFFGGL